MYVSEDDGPQGILERRAKEVGDSLRVAVPMPLYSWKARGQRTG